jgi:hypothetical protein
MTCPEIITAVKDVLIGVAAAVTAIVAIIGLTSWKRELTGRAEFKVARKFIRATYQLREALRNCRSPIIWSGEFPAGYNGINSSSHERAEAYAHAYQNRWSPVSKAMQEFDAQTLEAETFWGGDIPTKANVLRQCVGEVRAGARGHRCQRE